jgi:hypothetical protein
VDIVELQVGRRADLRRDIPFHDLDELLGADLHRPVQEEGRESGDQHQDGQRGRHRCRIPALLHDQGIEIAVPVLRAAHIF